MRNSQKVVLLSKRQHRKHFFFQQARRSCRKGWHISEILEKRVPWGILRYINAASRVLFFFFRIFAKIRAFDILHRLAQSSKVFFFETPGKKSIFFCLTNTRVRHPLAPRPCKRHCQNFSTVTEFPKKKKDQTFPKESMCRRSWLCRISQKSQNFPPQKRSKESMCLKSWLCRISQQSQNFPKKERSKECIWPKSWLCRISAKSQNSPPPKKVQRICVAKELTLKNSACHRPRSSCLKDLKCVPRKGQTGTSVCVCVCVCVCVREREIDTRHQFSFFFGGGSLFLPGLRVFT